MNYIIFDLEWNQCPDGKDKENKDLPFEIVEIGAVKLNDNREIIDEFHDLVSPVVYNKINRITMDIIKLSIEDLRDGDPFPVAMEKFFAWCEEGGEYYFGTWGSMDLSELQRNCRFFGVKHDFPMPLKYYDIQKLYSICYSDGKTRASLETAIDEMKIEKDIPFHAALFDATYTAKVMAAMDFDKVKIYESVDTFVIPKNRAEEYNLNFGTYSKYVSRGFADREHVMEDENVKSTICYKCGRSVKKKIRWFSNNQKMFYSLGYCETDGYLKGKIRIKKTEDDLFYAMKILKLTDESGASEIRRKQKDTRDKRREKRHREKEKLRGQK